VTVDIHGGRNIRVPQKIHDQAGVHTLHEQKRRRGMPEIMEAQPGILPTCSAPNRRPAAHFWDQSACVLADVCVYRGLGSERGTERKRQVRWPSR
jgi:hypothetical protein